MDQLFKKNRQRLSKFLKGNLNIFRSMVRFAWLMARAECYRVLVGVRNRQINTPQDKKTILTLCSGGLGDMIFASSFFLNHRNNYPEDLIHAIVPPWYVELFEKNFPFVDRVIPYPSHQNKIGQKNEIAFFRDLYKHNYDKYYCICDYSFPRRIPYNLYGSFIGYVLSIPMRAGIYRQDNTQASCLEKKLIRFVFETKSMFTHSGFSHHGNHFTHEHGRLLSLSDRPHLTHGYSLKTDPETDMSVQNRLKHFTGKGGPVVLITPSSAYKLKQWPVEQFAGLADRLVKDFNARIIVTGGGE